MREVSIITSIYGGYDNLNPTLLQNGTCVDWVLVTDRIPEDALGWRVVVEPSGLNPVRAAKRAKLFPWLYTEAQASVWIDSSFQVQSESFAQEALSYAKPIAQFAHPWRDCLFLEAQYLSGLFKDQAQAELIRKQSEFYRANNHPEHWGLWATGVIARHHTKSVRAMSFSWQHDIEEWSHRDQVSQAYSLRLSSLYPESFPGDYFSSPWIRYVGHRHED